MEIGIVGSNYIYFGHTTTNIGAWTTRTYASGSTHYFNAQTFIFNNDGYGSYQHMALTANGVNLRGKNTIDSTDSWLRLNQSGDYGSGVYTPGLMRADGGFYVSGSQVWHAGNLTNLNQLSNGPGYITGYSETDTLQSVTSRGASTNTGLYINNNNPTLYLQDTDHRSAMIHVNSDYFYILNGAGTNSTGWAQQANSRWLFMGNLNNNDITFGGSGDFAGTVTASGGNSSNWNTAYGWGNHASGGYLRLNTWEGNSYIGTSGAHYGTVFYDSNDTSYYADPTSTSNLNYLSVVGYQYIGGQTSN